MALFTKECLENLRQRIDLADVLSSHIDMKRSGAAYKALCPFHDEKTPSFMIQKGDSHYHCFGCGAHGDAITFLMNHLKMNFYDAVESLAQRYQVHLETIEGDKENRGANKALLKEALEQACRFYHFILQHTEEGHEALRYLYGRGLDLDFIRQFHVGLAPKSPGIFRKIMHGKFVKDETMAEAGLLVAGKEGGWREFFYDRITFPIRDATGAVIGFSARKYKETTFGGKYVNTSETPLFKKSRVLFGLNYCRRRIAKERKVIIVEGQIDALRLIQAGFNITVAGQGTAFGEGHAKELITLGVNEVYLAMDADDAGQEATRKMGNLFQTEGIETKVLQMPAGMDPDAFLRKYGVEPFLKLMEESIDYLTFLVRHQSKKIDLNSPAGKNELVQLISQQVRDWQHEVVRYESLRKLAHLVQVPEDMVLMGQAAQQPNLYIKKSGVLGLVSIDPERILEGDFLRLLLLFGETYPKFAELARLNLGELEFRVLICRSLYEKYMQLSQANAPRDLLSLATQIEDPECQTLIAEIVHKKVNKEKVEVLFFETIQKILDRNWMQKREEVKMKIQSGQASDEEVLALVKEFDYLKANPPKVKIS